MDKKKIFHVQHNNTDLQLQVGLEMVQLDGKTHKIVSGRGGAFCLLCSTPKSEMKNLKLVDSGMPMDMGIKDVWEHFFALADQTMDGEYFIDTKRIPTELRAGITQPPLAEDLNFGDFIPPLHAWLRFLSFFLELAMRLKAKHFKHGATSDAMKEEMEQAKKWLREEAREALKRGYLTPSAFGGTSDDGNGARIFFSAKFRDVVINLFKTGNLPQDVEDISEETEEASNTIEVEQSNILPKLLRNVSVILRILSSDKGVSLIVFPGCIVFNKMIFRFGLKTMKPSVRKLIRF